MTYKLITLLGIIGTYSNRDGYAWPSRLTLAKRMGGIAVTTISNHLARLKDLGYLEVAAQTASTGAQTVNMYRIIYYAPLPPLRDRLKITGYEDIEQAYPVKNEGGLSPESTGGLSPESTGGLSPESTGGVESGLNPERPILTTHMNDPRNETRAQANEQGASGLSFVGKNKGLSPERPRSKPTPLQPPHMPETGATTAQTPLPPTPSAPSTYGVERFMYWRDLRVRLEPRFGSGFLRNYFDNAKLYERGPGDYVVVCRTPMVQEQLLVRAHSEMVLQLAPIVRSHVELEIIAEPRAAAVAIPTYVGPQTGGVA